MLLDGTKHQGSFLQGRSRVMQQDKKNHGRFIQQTGSDVMKVRKSAEKQPFDYFLTDADSLMNALKSVI